MKYTPIVWDIETTGLNPVAEYWWSDQKKAQVLAISFATIPDWNSVSDPEDAEINVYTYYDKNEYRLLDVIADRMFRKAKEDYMDVSGEAFSKVNGTEFLSRSGSNPEPFFVGFNSRSFDHTYMGARFSRKRLNGWPITHGWKRLDMQRVAGTHVGIGDYPSQEDYAAFHGVDVPDEYDGSQVPQFFDDGNMEAIKSHCSADVEELAKLFMRDRDEAMEEFYDHYDIDAEPNFAEEVDI